MEGDKSEANFSHEAIQEWLLWRNDMPSVYSCMADMPVEVAEGFLFLRREFGKQGKAISPQHFLELEQRIRSRL